MSTPIPIVADIPTSDPGLGFSEYAEAIADAVRGGTPAQFTIGIYGAWGSGKSSLLSAIAERLSEDRDIIPVQFDAWRYERSGHIVVPLLHSIHGAATELGDKTVASYLRRALTSVLYSVNFKLGVIEVNPSQSLEAQEEAPLLPLDNAFAKPFADLKRIPEALKDRRVAVLIDDLDRCSPDNVVAVLESINLVMDIPGFVFILALDYDVLVRAVQQRYPHASAHAFIEKMVQVPFRVPRLNLSGRFLEDLIPGWPSLHAAVPRNFTEYAHDIAHLGLEANPRQIKRFINSFLLLGRIVSSRQLNVDYSLLAALIGLQLRWPEQYLILSNGVFSGQERPQDKLRYARENPALEQYSQRFFSDNTSPTELQLLLQLTAAVAPPEPTEETAATPAPPELTEETEATPAKVHALHIGSEDSSRYNLLLPAGAVSGKGAIAERGAPSRDAQEAVERSSVHSPTRPADVKSPPPDEPRGVFDVEQHLNYPEPR